MHPYARLGILVVILALLPFYHVALVRLVKWVFYVIFSHITLTFTVQIDLLYVFIAGVSLGCLFLLAFYYWSRERYAQLRSVPSRTTIELEPLVAEEDEALPISNILSSIRIFGYLDSIVYTELANAAEEKLVEEGDHLDLCEKDFYVVIDGVARLVMSCKGVRNDDDDNNNEDNDKSDDDSLLNEIGRGGVASSIFDILAVLTGQEVLCNEKGSCPKFKITSNGGPLRLLKIPSEAFKDITRKHPKAVGHIIQVILSRFQRVTFATLNEYLGLSDKALAMECLFDAIPIPQSFHTETLQGYLKKVASGNTFGNLSSVIPKGTHNEICGMALQLLGGGPEERPPSKLQGYLEIIYAQPDSILVKQGQKSSGFMIVLYGSLTASKTFADGRRAQKVVDSGQSIGLMATVMGSASAHTVTTRTACVMVHISKRNFEQLIDLYPTILLFAAARLLQSVDSTIYAIDHALEWSHCHAGHVLAHQGEPATSIYLVLHGRLRCIREPRDGVSTEKSTATPQQTAQICGEYGSGHSVGELETLLGSKWPGTLQAVRDTDVACIPKLLFDALTRKHPLVSLAITQKLAVKLQESLSRSTLEVPGREVSNLRTIGILPVEPALYRLAVDFCHRLREELNCSAPTLLLESTHVIDRLGKHAFSAIGKLKLLEFLNQVEADHRIVLYLADPVPRSRWTRRCIRQADCIFLIADAGGNSQVGAFERVLLGVPSCARKELVLIHSSIYCRSGLTRDWLNHRIWITDHHHVYLEPHKDLGEGRMAHEAAPQVHLWQIVREQLEKYGIADLPTFGELLRSRVRRWQAPSLAAVIASATCDDFGRLARRILNKSIGVVLGGGGARGLSHVGVLQALIEAGIPIDAIGGTSIGAFMASLYARDMDHYTVAAFAKSFAQRMASKWRQALDLTYPITSWFTGHAFNRSLWKMFGDRHIEDLWIPYYCVTTDIAKSRMMVHRTGYVWRYVRASMSLCGILPPLCDQGSLLVDGGYMDNVPVDVMLDSATSTVIAIDVGAEDATELEDYGDTLSGFWLLFWRIFGRKKLVPTLTEIQSRLAFVSCTNKLEAVRAAAVAANGRQNIFLLRPPVQQYGVLDFGEYEALLSIGYSFGKSLVEEWRSDGTLKMLLGYTKNEYDSPGLLSSSARGGEGADPRDQLNGLNETDSPSAVSSRADRTTSAQRRRASHRRRQSL